MNTRSVPNLFYTNIITFKLSGQNDEKRLASPTQNNDIII